MRPLPTGFDYEDALSPEEGVTRRDPSDVLRVGGTYYVWYSKVREDEAGERYPSGYDAGVWYATSPDGREWTERGRAVGPDEPWCAGSAFTPNALAADGTYYLFYTGVPEAFRNEYPDATGTAIGVAVADSPDGPWRPHDANPVLEPGPTGTWDDFRVDDACLLRRGDRYYLYYKGVTQFAENWPRYTPMGVAVAPDPTGPYERSPYNPLLQPGHEVLAWPQDGGVAALARASAGPRDDGGGVWVGDDGLQFRRAVRLAETPGAPGAFRDPEGGIAWGVCHARREREGGTDLYLRRFDPL